MSADEIFILVLVGVCVAVVAAMAVYSRRHQVADAVHEGGMAPEDVPDEPRRTTRRQRRAQ